VEERDVVGLFDLHTPKLLRCLLDFAETYSKSSYFSNYNVLYVGMKARCVNCDYLFLKEAALVFARNGRNFGDLLTCLFEANREELTSSGERETLE
jgi:hypothetical protein